MTARRVRPSGAGQRGSEPAGPGPPTRAEDGASRVTGGETRLRLGVAAVGIPLCVLVVYAGGMVFLAGLALLAGVGAREFVSMYRSRGDGPFLWVAVAGAALFPPTAGLLGLQQAWAGGAGLLMVVSFVALTRLPPERGPGVAAALTAFSVLYVGGLLAFAVPLRDSFTEGRAAGTLLFFMPVAVTWLADTAAYFGGRAVGRRPLAPQVSPNKTVAGAAGALAAGVVGGGIYGSWILPLAGPEMGLVRGLALGLAVSVAAILGDLVESSLKRECEVKDSSGLLPGHGGLLDRLDSLLWVFPVAYLFLSFT